MLNKINKKELLYTIIIVLFFLLLIELFLRVILPFPLSSVPTYRSDKAVLYFHKANSKGYELSPLKEYRPIKLEYDKNGFRGDNNKYKEIKNRKIVFIIGDSFAESRQVEQAKTTAELLNKAVKDYYFINSGCSGYTTTTAFLLLKNRLLKFKPAKVILFFCFNDYYDNFHVNNGYYTQKDIFYRQPDQKFIHRDYDISIFAFDDWLNIHSALYALLKQLFNPPQPAKYYKKIAEGSNLLASPKQANRPEYLLNPREREVIAFTHRGLSEMNELCRKNNIDFEVLIIPLPPQVSAQEWRLGKQTWGYKENEVIVSRVYQDRLLRFCQKNAIKCYDLLPVFKQKTKLGKLYYDYDGHWTPWGDQVVAEVIKKTLKK